jgi:hypothetical protein
MSKLSPRTIRGYSAPAGAGRSSRGVTEFADLALAVGGRSAHVIFGSSGTTLAQHNAAQVGCVAALSLPPRRGDRPQA